jgi:hypothetical protein
MTTTYTQITDAEADNLWESDGYAEYIMAHSAGERVICNGDTLLDAMEDYYLFEDYLNSLGLTQ